VDDEDPQKDLFLDHSVVIQKIHLLKDLLENYTLENYYPKSTYSTN